MFTPVSCVRRACHEGAVVGPVQHGVGRGHAAAVLHLAVALAARVPEQHPMVWHCSMHMPQVTLLAVKPVLIPQSGRAR